MFKTVIEFFKGAMRGVSKTQHNFIGIVIFCYLILMMIPMLEWGLKSERSLIYNLLNTFLLPLIIVGMIILIPFGVKNFKGEIKSEALNQVLEFLTESRKKITFLPLFMKMTLIIITLITIFISSIFIFQPDTIEFSFSKEIILVISVIFIVYVPVILIAWIVDFFRYR